MVFVYFTAPAAAYSGKNAATAGVPLLLNDATPVLLTGPAYENGEALRLPPFL
jgi:hypothetical protein